MAQTDDSALYVYPAEGSELHMRGGDEGPKHNLLARQADGTAFDLTAATVTVDLLDTRGWTSKAAISCTLVTAAAGIFNFTVASGDLDKLRPPSRQQVVVKVAGTPDITSVNPLYLNVGVDL